MTFGRPQVWGKGGSRGPSLWRPHRSLFLRSFCPNLSAISTTLKLSHNVAVSFCLDPAPWREGGSGWDTGRQHMAQERPGQAGASPLTPLTCSPMVSPSWHLGTVRPISSAPWWPSRTHTPLAWPSGHCMVWVVLAAGGGAGGGGPGRAELCPLLQVRVCW